MCVCRGEFLLAPVFFPPLRNVHVCATLPRPLRFEVAASPPLNRFREECIRVPGWISASSVPLHVGGPAWCGGDASLYVTTLRHLCASEHLVCFHATGGGMSIGTILLCSYPREHATFHKCCLSDNGVHIETCTFTVMQP